MRATAGLGITNITWTVIATRGERLVLTRARYSGRDQTPDAFLTEVLAVTKSTSTIGSRRSSFSIPTHSTAAFTELDTRYAAGESAAHSRTWSVLTQAYAAFKPTRLPPRRRTGPVCRPSPASLRAGRHDCIHLRRVDRSRPDLHIYIEAVHRLSDRGAVVTQYSKGRRTKASTPSGGRSTSIQSTATCSTAASFSTRQTSTQRSRRFDELARPAPRLENAASQVIERFKRVLCRP